MMGSTTSGRYPSRIPGLRHAFTLWRSVRRWLSRREWSVDLLGLPVSEGTTDEPGLVLLQIDGLARPQLERALREGRMPFLRRLLRTESYRIQTMYSGQPATTPAVLGELFYGVEQAVPAFGFRDHRSGEVVEMFHPGIAATVQAELEQQGAALLREGSAYCDIYSGGAQDSSFCPATMGWQKLQEAALWRRLALLLLNVMSIVRIIGLSVVELMVAIGDCVRGLYRGRGLLAEVLYIPRRVLVNVGLSEAVAICAEADVTRGVRVLHANFLGYDENAHHRGPDAQFAHYALRGIDRAIQRVWDAAQASHRRNYQVWIMADHGQEHTIPYSQEFGRSIQSAVGALYCNPPASGAEKDSSTALESPATEQLQRSRWLRRQAASPMAASPPETAGGAEPGPVTVAIGPLGYVYWPGQLLAEEIEQLAQRLVCEARVPLVLAVLDEQVWAWNERGRYSMPEQAAEVLAPGHPHLPQVAQDLARLCLHPDAGRFLISGWRNGRRPLTFVAERGSHAGPGPQETTGFVMLSPDAPRPLNNEVFRPGTLRRLVQSVLGREPLGRPERTPESHSGPVRLVTYNVHSCIGLDGWLSPARIARVLAATAPDIIALQELDVLRSRTGGVDQAEQIARALGMELHFYPSLQVESGGYGNAILSRLPMKFINAGPLPRGRPYCEQRGALWMEIDVHGSPLQVITTHLGLTAAERAMQIEHLFGPDWLDAMRRRRPVVMCGDFNAMPGSRLHRRICTWLRDAQLTLEAHRPLRTWFGPFPLTRIDHVFISDGVRARRIEVPRTRLSQVASDHLPVVVDLEISSDNAPRQMTETTSRHCSQKG